MTPKQKRLAEAQEKPSATRPVTSELIMNRDFVRGQKIDKLIEDPELCWHTDQSTN